MKVQSRLLGYFSGKPGDLMTPLLEVKFLEHSGPVGRMKEQNERKSYQTQSVGKVVSGGSVQWTLKSSLFQPVC